MQATTRASLPRGGRTDLPPPPLGYGDLVGAFLDGNTARRKDMMQGGNGRSARHAPEVLRQTVTLDDLRAEGVDGRTVYEALPMPQFRPNFGSAACWGAVQPFGPSTARAIQVAALREALVVDVGGAVRTADGRWLRDLQPCSVRGYRKALPKMMAREGYASERLEGTSALLLLSSSRNYYHWLHQIFPQASAILMAHPLGAIDQWLVRELPDFGAEMLERLGIDLNRVRRVGECALTCERLVVGTVPSMGALDYTGEWPRSLIRRAFGPIPQEKPWRRLYLRRADDDRRPILNRRELEALLLDHGYEILELEGLSVKAQAAYLAEASHVVAAHGAGLANLVFCAPGTRVIELLPRLWPSPLFGMVSQTCGLDHTFLPGREACLSGLGVRHNSAATIVPLGRLARLLRACDTR